MKEIKNIKFSTLFILVLIYKTTLDYIYIDIITQYYDYFGLILNFNKTKYIISFALVLFSLFPLKKLFDNYNKPSAIIMVVLYLFYFFPNFTYNSISDVSDEFYLLSIAYFVILNFAYFYFRIPSFKNFHRKVRGSREFYFLFFFVIGLTLIFTVMYNGLKLKIDLTDIYKIRAEVKEMDLPGLFGYLKPLSSKLIAIGLVYFLINKNQGMVVLLVIIGLMFFSFGAHKTDFFFIIISFIIYFFYRIKLGLFILYGLIFLNLVTIIVYLYKGPLVIEIISLIHVRTLFAPNLLSYYYFDYYSLHNLLLLQEHYIHWLGLKEPNSMNSPHIIGLHYFNSKDMAANNGMIGSDYAQFGWYMLLFFPFLRVFFFRILDYSARGIDNRIIILISISFGLEFINGAFFTTLLTGGFLFISLILYVMPRKGSTSN